MKVVGKEEQAWLAEFVNTEAMKHGLKYIAFVLPESVFGKLAVKLYIETTLKKGSHNIEIKTFTNVDKAQEWLKENAKSI